jgi:hypothetical protein
MFFKSLLYNNNNYYNNNNNNNAIITKHLWHESLDHNYKT